MTYSIGFEPGSIELDAFLRLRTSTPTTLFDSSHDSDIQSLLWWNDNLGGGTCTHDGATSVVNLTVTGASGAQAARESRAMPKYQPGKGHRLMLTATLPATIAANQECRWGLFDAQEGVGWGADSSGPFVFIRKAGNDTRKTQSEWLNNLDGSWQNAHNHGPKLPKLDTSKAQIYDVALEWLGVGSVMFWLLQGGRAYPMYMFEHINELTSPYMLSASLPVRYEIKNTDESSANTMKQICSVIMSEGGADISPGRGHALKPSIWSADVAVTTRRPIVSVRMRADPWGTGKRNRTQMVLDGITTRVATNDLAWELVYGGTLSGGADAWTAVDSTSGFEYNTDHTTITGGVTAESGWAIAGTGITRSNNTQEIKSRYACARIGTSPVQYAAWTIVGTSMSGTSNVRALMDWTEYR